MKASAVSLQVLLPSLAGWANEGCKGILGSGPRRVANLLSCQILAAGRRLRWLPASNRPLAWAPLRARPLRLTTVAPDRAKGPAVSFCTRNPSLWQARLA